MWNPGPRAAGIFLGGLVMMGTACAHGRGTAADFGRPLGPGGAVQLYVTNNSGAATEVYAAGSGTLYRIGTVHPGLARHFLVRPSMIVNGPVEFVARSGNGPLRRSGRILLRQGDKVDFDLTPSPVTSTAIVRGRLTGRKAGAIES